MPHVSYLASLLFHFPLWILGFTHHCCVTHTRLLLLTDRLLSMTHSVLLYTSKSPYKP